MNLRNPRRQIPVVPLPPGHRLRRVKSAHNRQRPRRILPVHVDGNAPAAIRRIQQIGSIFARLRHIDSHVEPLTRHRPSHIKQVRRRRHLVIRVIVNLRVFPELGVRSIDSLVHPKLVQIAPVGRIQRPASVILCVGIMIGNTFAAHVVIGAHHLPGNRLRPALILAVVVRRPLVLSQKIRLKRAKRSRSQQQCRNRHNQRATTKEVLHGICLN